MEQLGSPWTALHEICYLSISQNCVENIQVSLKSDNNSRYFTEDECIFKIIPHSILFRMRTVSDRRCREHKKTHILYVITFFQKSSIYEMWKNIVEPNKPKMTV
jgi:hypothetical protein